MNEISIDCVVTVSVFLFIFLRKYLHSWLLGNKIERGSLKWQDVTDVSNKTSAKF